jgi:hypothetical protein
MHKDFGNKWYGIIYHKLVGYGKWNIMSDMVKFDWKYSELVLNGKCGAWRACCGYSNFATPRRGNSFD